VQQHLIRQSLSGIAFDLPMLLALFLLQSIRADLIEKPFNPARLNAKRARTKQPPLLEHIEVSAPVSMQVARPHSDDYGSPRRAPRFHHVRGHIVRRHNSIYWRAPHWRGHIRLGSVRSRTVTLEMS
jgi:hypothetical protein